MYSWKKLLALLISVVMLLSLAACGGKEEPQEPADKPNTSTPSQNTPAAKPEAPDTNLTVHENTFFTVSYDEAAGWSLAEDDIYLYEDGGSVDICILDDEGYAEIMVSIEAIIDDPESFREDLYYNDVDMKAYAAGEVETVNVGGQSMVCVDEGYGERYFFGRNEAAGVTYTIDVSNWDDPRVPPLVESIVCTASGTDNIDPPWPWEGEPIMVGAPSLTIGDYSVMAEMLPLSEPLTTFETFDHDIEAIDDTIYVLSEGVLRQYQQDNSGLVFVKEIPLDDEYESLDSTDGVLILSGFMRPVTGYKDGQFLYSYEGPDKFTLAPDGSWGISWFYSGEECEKYTFQDDGLVGEPFPFPEVGSISQLCVDDSYIYLCGSPADGNDHLIFVYDHSGKLQMRLGGDPNGSFGLGSVTFVTKTANGFLAMDGNMREVVLWAKDGTWLGSAEDSDLFCTYYPWFAAGDVMDDGSILVVMTEDRPDGSAMEAIVFRITVN